MSVKRVVVVGGGISGLAAAWSVQQEAARIDGGVEVLVLERGDEVGGKARSVLREGWLIEGGPSGFLGGRPAMDRLIAGSGLSADLVQADAAAARRFVYRAGRMRQIVANPMGFMRSGILSARGFTRMMAEPFIPARRDGFDESVWAFAARRLGSQVADRLIMPMTLGVFAGDAHRLSLASAFPRMAALEREHGSLIRGLVARRGRTSSGALTSFREGMQSLPRALARRGGFGVRCGAEVRMLARTEHGWRVAAEGDVEAIPADVVILAGEPWASAALLRSLAPGAAEALDAIPCPAVGVVALGFGPGALGRVPSGFGVLIARGEGFRMLGNLWESYLYPGRGPKGHVLIRAMFGGSVDSSAGMLSEPDLSALAREEVARLYSITEAPVFEQVLRTPRAIPQYEIGHRERVACVDRAAGSLPGLFVTGSGLRGIAFADAATDGVAMGERAVEWLATGSTPDGPAVGPIAVSTRPSQAGNATAAGMPR